ncbi:rod shape-determining protein MreD [Castellaniella caeni]|uniref:rod shape-determining protein MreD n=1 Tax=Castellaniella caeni TaxID=266123 RepID=UPI0015E13F78|nr:rod shape-determining protein MreD [Castellaniella caeni]
MPLVTTRRPAGGSSLMSLQPVDASPFQRPSSAWLVWGSLILVWMASLLPWRLWSPVPDVLLLVLCFWCLHESDRVGLLTAFIFGLLMDVHDSGLLGLHALCYVLSTYGVLRLQRRLEHFNVWVQTFHVVPVLVFAALVSRLFGAWLNGEWVGWDWLWSALITGVLWPLADILLLLPQRRLDGDDVGVV